MTFARKLRKNTTKAEYLLWDSLRSNHLGEKFRRQIEIGPFVADFCCFSKKLIIELDGEFHKRTNRRKVDINRTKFLENLGYRVVRFWNGDVENNIEMVLEKIRKNLTPRSSGASRQPAFSRKLDEGKI